MYSVSNSSLTSGVGWGEFYVTHTGRTGLDWASIPLSVKSHVEVRAFSVGHTQCRQTSEGRNSFLGMQTLGSTEEDSAGPSQDKA